MTFRVARHSNDLKPLVEFYTKILGLDLIGRFDEHENYNGVFFGKKGCDWHLEFTQSDVKAEHTFDEDDMLVFYPNKTEYEAILQNITINKIKTLRPINPYWQRFGTMIADPDGFRIVISNQKAGK